MILSCDTILISNPTTLRDEKTQMNNSAPLHSIGLFLGAASQGDARVRFWGGPFEIPMSSADNRRTRVIYHAPPYSIFLPLKLLQSLCENRDSQQNTATSCGTFTRTSWSTELLLRRMMIRSRSSDHSELPIALVSLISSQ